MSRLLEYLIVALGAWLCLSPLALGHSGVLGFAVPIAVGALAIILACVGMKSKTIQGNFAVIIVIGICLALWGIVGGFLFDGVAGINELVVGVLLAALAAVCLPLQIDVETARFFNRSGAELASISKVTEKKGNLLAKTVLLGSMPETIFIKPEELCALLSILDFDVVKKLPGMFYASWKAQRQTKVSGDKA